MATSLARQLQSLQAPQTDTFLHQGRKKASLLFDPAEAANHDFEDIRKIGEAGLEDLLPVNISLTYLHGNLLFFIEIVRNHGFQDYPVFVE